MRIVNLFYQALHIKNFPEYLKLHFAPKKRLLRTCNNNNLMVEISGYGNSFTSKATHLFNELPKTISLKRKNIFTIEH